MLARKAAIVRSLLSDWPVNLGQDFDSLTALTLESVSQNNFCGLIRVGIGGVIGRDATL